MFMSESEEVFVWVRIQDRVAKREISDQRVKISTG